MVISSLSKEVQDIAQFLSLNLDLQDSDTMKAIRLDDDIYTVTILTMYGPIYPKVQYRGQQLVLIDSGRPTMIPGGFSVVDRSSREFVEVLQNLQSLIGESLDSRDISSMQRQVVNGLIYVITLSRNNKIIRLFKSSDGIFNVIDSGSTMPLTPTVPGGFSDVYPSTEEFQDVLENLKRLRGELIDTSDILSIKRQVVNGFIYIITFFRNNKIIRMFKSTNGIFSIIDVVQPPTPRKSPTLPIIGGFEEVPLNSTEAMTVTDKLKQFIGTLDMAIVAIKRQLVNGINYIFLLSDKSIVCIHKSFSGVYSFVSREKPTTSRTTEVSLNSQEGRDLQTFLDQSLITPPARFIEKLADTYTIVLQDNSYVVISKDINNRFVIASRSKPSYYRQENKMMGLMSQPTAGPLHMNYFPNKKNIKLWENAPYLTFN